MKIHAIQTGTVAITTAWREGVGHGRRRLVHTILDRSWTAPLPIYAFVIEHPEGVIVVDTGCSAPFNLGMKRQSRAVHGGDDAVGWAR